MLWWCLMCCLDQLAHPLAASLPPAALSALFHAQLDSFITRPGITTAIRMIFFSNPAWAPPPLPPPLYLIAPAPGGDSCPCLPCSCQSPATVCRREGWLFASASPWQEWGRKWLVVPRLPFDFVPFWISSHVPFGFLFAQVNLELLQPSVCQKKNDISWKNNILWIMMYQIFFPK